MSPTMQLCICFSLCKIRNKKTQTIINYSKNINTKITQKNLKLLGNTVAFKITTNSFAKYKFTRSLSFTKNHPFLFSLLLCWFWVNFDIFWQNSSHRSPKYLARRTEYITLEGWRTYPATGDAELQFCNTLAAMFSYT